MEDSALEISIRERQERFAYWEYLNAEPEEKEARKGNFEYCKRKVKEAKREANK